jgi:hypothetical protein
VDTERPRVRQNFGTQSERQACLSSTPSAGDRNTNRMKSATVTTQRLLNHFPAQSRSVCRSVGPPRLIIGSAPQDLLLRHAAKEYNDIDREKIKSLVCHRAPTL